MIKRLLFIGIFTGAAHVTTLIVLKKLTGLIPLDVIKLIGETDSLINFILSILAAGLLMTSVREIATSQNWKHAFNVFQQARVTLSILLIFLGVLGMFQSSYFLFAFAPVFAMNADYALYGRGLPITASILAFSRVFVPFIALFLASLYWPNQIIPIFVCSSVILYFFSGIVISKILGAPYFIKPSLQSLKLYLMTIPLGVVSFSYYFLGLGIIMIADHFYSAAVVAIAYIAIKIYVIFKGVLRILNQAFISEMTNDLVCHKVDYLAFSAGTILVTGTSLFVNAFRGLFLDARSGGTNGWVHMVGISCFLISPLVSLTTKAILEKKDRPYAYISLISLAVSAILCYFLSFILSDEKGILLSIIVGELITILGLLQILDKWGWLKQRFHYFTRNIFLLSVPILIRLLAGDSKITLLLSLSLYGILLFMFNRNLFSLQTEKKNEQKIS